MVKDVAQLTIQIPDELAQRLEPLQSRLPELLWLLLDIGGEQNKEQPKLNTQTLEIPEVYQEVLDF